MLNILSSNAPEPNPKVREVPRKGREGNLAWIERNLPKGDGALLLMLGGRDPIPFRIRIAQAELRHDLTPSNWSHLALLDEPEEGLEGTGLSEISLEPAGGFGMPAATNGVQRGKLATYRSSRRWPNLALLRLPVPRQEIEGAMARFERQRAALDAVDMTVAWLAYVWGAGQGTNPLTEGIGLPAAALVEAASAASGYDLTPGLESRASCPEAVWQAARWWHPFYDERQHRPPHGASVVTHRIE